MSNEIARKSETSELLLIELEEKNMILFKRISFSMVNFIILSIYDYFLTANEKLLFLL